MSHGEHVSDQIFRVGQCPPVRAYAIPDFAAGAASSFPLSSSSPPSSPTMCRPRNHPREAQEQTLPAPRPEILVLVGCIFQIPDTRYQTVSMVSGFRYQIRDTKRCDFRVSDVDISSDTRYGAAWAEFSYCIARVSQIRTLSGTERVSQIRSDSDSPCTTVRSDTRYMYLHPIGT